jgi:hypothetical protein
MTGAIREAGIEMTYNSSIDLERDASQQFQIDTRVANSRKSALIAYVLWFCFTGLGIHNFYLGKPALGGLQLTGTLIFLAVRASQHGPLMLFGIACGVLVVLSLLADPFLIPARVRAHSEKMRARLEEGMDWRGA